MELKIIELSISLLMIFFLIMTYITDPGVIPKIVYYVLE